MVGDLPRAFQRIRVGESVESAPSQPGRPGDHQEKGFETAGVEGRVSKSLPAGRLCPGTCCCSLAKVQQAGRWQSRRGTMLGLSLPAGEQWQGCSTEGSHNRIDARRVGHATPAQPSCRAGNSTTQTGLRERSVQRLFTRPRRSSHACSSANVSSTVIPRCSSRSSRGAVNSSAWISSPNHSARKIMITAPK